VRSYKQQAVVVCLTLLLFAPIFFEEVFASQTAFANFASFFSKKNEDTKLKSLF